MKQTAVEWIEGYLKKFNHIEDTLSLRMAFNQAKEMEKQEIINSFVDGADKGEMFNNENRAFTTDAEQYYNETFKSE